MVYMGHPFLLLSFLVDVIHDMLLVVKGLLSSRSGRISLNSNLEILGHYTLASLLELVAITGRPS